MSRVACPEEREVRRSKAKIQRAKSNQGWPPRAQVGLHTVTVTGEGQTVQGQLGGRGRPPSSCIPWRVGGAGLAGGWMFQGRLWPMLFSLFIGSPVTGGMPGPRGARKSGW